MFLLGTILHPTDFSEGSEVAFQAASRLARDYNARLILLHVISPAEAIYGGGPVTTANGHGGEKAAECLREMEKSHWRLPCPTALQNGVGPAAVGQRG